VRHSEFNPSSTAPVHLYQIWLLPEAKGLTPSYEQKFFDASEKRGKLRLVASPNGAAGSLAIHQDARIYLALLEPGETVTHSLADGRHAWLQVLRGAVSAGGNSLEAGDGLAVSDERSLVISGARAAEVMLFDLP
jgi:redox-sensitive bicupin YhaK (pirin superfamily)